MMARSYEFALSWSYKSVQVAASHIDVKTPDGHNSQPNPQ